MSAPRRAAGGRTSAAGGPRPSPRTLRALAATEAALLVLLGACGGTAPTRREPGTARTERESPDERSRQQPRRRRRYSRRQAESERLRRAKRDELVGLWTRGRRRLELRDDGRFRWERPADCDVPPCPLERLEGSWTQREERLVLQPDDRPAVRLKTAVEPDPPRLLLRPPDGEAWRTLERRER